MDKSNIVAIVAGAIDAVGWFCVIMGNCNDYARRKDDSTPKEKKRYARNVLKSLVLGWIWPFALASQPLLALGSVIRDAELGELIPGAKEKGEGQLSITSRDGRVEKK